MHILLQNPTISFVNDTTVITAKYQEDLGFCESRLYFNGTNSPGRFYSNLGISDACTQSISYGFCNFCIKLSNSSIPERIVRWYYEIYLLFVSIRLGLLIGKIFGLWETTFYNENGKSYNNNSVLKTALSI